LRLCVGIGLIWLGAEMQKFQLKAHLRKFSNFVDLVIVNFALTRWHFVTYNTNPILASPRTIPSQWNPKHLPQSDDD